MQPFEPKRPMVFVFVDYLHHAPEILNVPSFEASVLALSFSRSLPWQMMFPVRERAMKLSNVPCPCSFCSVRKLLLFTATVVLRFIYVPKKRILSSAIGVQFCQVRYGTCQTVFE